MDKRKEEILSRKLPQIKTYQIIYADPPWEYKSSDCLAKNSCLSGKYKKPYEYIHLKDLKNLPIQNIADKNCLLFMWSTSPKLNEAIDLGKVWGFKYSTVVFVWDKQRTLPGSYTNTQVELCLIFKKGKIPTPRGSRKERQFLSENRREHSRKPDTIRDRIVKMFPTQNKIELFARQKTKGWTCMGSEISGKDIKQELEELNEN